MARVTVRATRASRPSLQIMNSLDRKLISIFKVLAKSQTGDPRRERANYEFREICTRLGDSIPLDETKACYFLLLGQALAVKIMPPTPKKDGEQP